MINYKKLHSFLTAPVKKNAGLFVNVKRFYTDVNGTVIDKNDPVVPLTLKVNYPFWMFGQFDAWGGYKIGNQVVAPDITTPYVGTFVVGKDIPFLFATGLNDIADRLMIGDIVHIFTDNLNAPSIYVWIIQNCGSASLASIYANANASEREKIKIESCNFFAYTNGSPNFQFARAIHLTKIDVVGAYTDDSFDPLSYDQVNNKQGNFVVIPVNFTVDQYHLVSSSIAFEVDSLQFSFIIKKNTIPTFGLDPQLMNANKGNFSGKDGNGNPIPMTTLFDKYKDVTI
jgi:hypothetical protein